MHDCGQGIVVSGCPGQPIRNVRFAGIRTAFWGGVEWYDRDAEDIPYLTDEYPECHKLGVLPSYGYFFQFAENVAVEGCTEHLINRDVRPLKLTMEYEQGT
jgi:hypothetical protein